jgi:hypothetical protein
MKRLLLSIAIVLSVLLSFGHVNAQAQDEGESLYSYGEVISIAEDQIMVREFDYTTGEEVDVVYFITSGTILDPVDSLDQVRPSDLVDIEFIRARDGNNIAIEIFIDRIE